MKRLLIIFATCFALVGCGALNQDSSLVEDFVEQEEALVAEISEVNQEVVEEQKNIETNLYLDDDTNVWMKGEVEDVQLTFSGGKNLCDGGENLTYENPTSNELGDLLIITVVCGEEKEVYLRDITSGESHNLGVGEQGVFTEGGIQIGEVIVDNPYGGRVIERKNVGGRMIFVKDYDVERTENLRTQCLTHQFDKDGPYQGMSKDHCSLIYAKGKVSFPKIKGEITAATNELWQLFYNNREFYLGVGTCGEGAFCSDYLGMNGGPETQISISPSSSTEELCLDKKGKIDQKWCISNLGEFFNYLEFQHKVVGEYVIRGKNYINLY